MVIGWRAEQREKLGSVQAWAQAESRAAAREDIKGRANSGSGLWAGCRRSWTPIGC